MNSNATRSLPRIHIVSAGDTLASLAQRYYGTVSDVTTAGLLNANPVLERGGELKTNQKVVIPLLAHDVLRR